MEHGPDGLDSPTYLKQNFNVQEAGSLSSQLALRIITYEYAILAMPQGICRTSSPPTSALRRGGMVTPRLLPSSILMLNGQMPKLYLQLWRMLWLKLNPSMGRWCGRVHRMTLLPSRLTPSLQLIVSTGTEIQRHLPETLHVEATGSYPIPWNISIRSDKEGQSVYGPSLAPMEETVAVPGPFGGTQTLQVTALGRSKSSWCCIILVWTVACIGMYSRRKSCLRFSSRVPQPAGPLHWKCLAHRRMSHVLWTDSMTLIWNLLMGARMGRYTGSPDTFVLDQRIELRGFSAGSFAGVSTVEVPTCDTGFLHEK